MNNQNNLMLIVEKLISLDSAIQSRLKWGVGANPALNDTLAAFEASIVKWKKQVEVSD